MGFPQTASSVTAGTQTQYGTAAAILEGNGFALAPLYSTEIGPFFVGASAGIVFDLAAASSPALALHFAFDGAPVLAARGWDSWEAGKSATTNATLSFAPIGFDSFVAPPMVVGASSRLDLDLSATPATDLALHLNFGGASLLSSVGGLYAFSSGAFRLETSVSLDAVGHLSFQSGSIRVGGSASLLFDFTTAPIPARELPLQFPFAGPLVVASAGGVESFSSGTAHVENELLGVWLTGLSSSARYGSPYVGEAPHVRLDLTSASVPDLALQFVFSGTPLLYGAGNLHSFSAGDFSVATTLPSVAPEGFRQTLLGQPSVGAFSGLHLDFDEAPARQGMPFQFYFGGINTRRVRFTGLGQDFLGVSPWALVWVRPYFRVYPVGLNATQWGEAQVSPLIIYLHGSSLTQYGNTVIWRDGEVQHIGGDSLHLGDIHVAVDNLIRPAGLNASLWGLIDAEYIPLVTQYVDLDDAEAGFESLVFGEEDHPADTWVSNWWRTLHLPDTYVTTGYGTPFIDFRLRYLDVAQGTNSLAVGQFTVGFHQDVDMVGRDQSAFGEHEVKVRMVYVFGLPSLTFGDPYDLRVAFGRRPITFQQGHHPRDYGVPYVWNLTQYVVFAPVCPEPEQYCGAVWGQKHFFVVKNRNRHLYPAGTIQTRFAVRPALVLNAGRALLVGPLENANFGPWYEPHLIAHYVRYLPMPGTDSFRAVSFHRVHNAASAMYPSGFVATQYGDLDKILWRWLHQNGRRHDESGVPWVSFSPRGFQMVSTREFVRLGKPFIAFGARYLEPPGRPPTFVDHLTVVTQKPIPRIRPQTAAASHRFGVARIKNVTPQLFVVGRSMFSSLPSANWVSHSPRYPLPLGTQTTRYGRPDVIFRDRVLPMEGDSSTRVSLLVRVENVDPDPLIPTQQTVFMSEWCKGKSTQRCALMGDKVESGDGGLIVTGNSIRPYTEFASSTYGEPTVVSMGILFKLEHHPHPFGRTTWGTASLNRPIIVSFGTTPMIGIGDTLYGGDESFGIPPPSLARFVVSPHTIWARLDTPAQAIENHKPESKFPFCEIDKFCHSSRHPFGESADGTGPWFGAARVHAPLGWDGTVPIVCGTSYNPTSERYKECHRYFARLGEPSIALLRRVVEFDGMRRVRFGYPRLMTPTTRTIRVWNANYLGTIVSDAFTVENRNVYLPNVTVGQSSVIGATRIENLNRPVYVAGLVATQWGGNNPMVHYPRTVTPVDSDLTQYGVTWVSHSPRTLFLAGFDSFVSEWTDFRGMMWVRQGRRFIRGYGYNVLTEWGTAVVAQAEPVLTPYGIAAPCVSPHVTVEFG